MILRIEVPGNPWKGAINRRDRAAVSSKGKLYNRKLEGFKAYQTEVAIMARQACIAQRWTRLDDPAQCWIVLHVPDRRRRDVDGPIKAILDGLTDGLVWADDSQVVRLIVDKTRGKFSARVQVRPAV